MHEVDLSYNERDYIVLMNSSINFTLKAFIVCRLYVTSDCTAQTYSKREGVSKLYCW